MLKSERLTLEPISEADVDHILTWVNNPSIIGNIATLSGEHFTRDEELAYIRRMRESKDDQVFSILVNGRYIGQAGVHQIYQRSRTGRIAIVIASADDMGKGYGSEAIKRLLDHAFSPTGMNLHKIWLLVFEGNKRSRRTYERVGFIKEGVLRKEYYHEGIHHNMVRMSILSEEWRTE
jgi:RimJ/RimL family protein N-acetyltransferase